MGMKKFSRYYSEIEFDQDVRKFLEENKNKIPKGVEVERASKSSINETIPEEEIVIHASTFKLGLRLPFHVLIEEILSKHHLIPTQLAPNCWRVMFGIIALNQICKINLGWNEFCHCYTVKSNRGIYYFSHKEGKPNLVTGLPRSEKGWESDDLIRLKGDWDTLHSVPRSETAADHKPKGFKSSDVNQCDIEKALEFQNRDWKYLIDHPAYLELHRENKIADESQSTLLTATGPAYSNLGGDVRSVEVVGPTTTDFLSSPPSSCKKQKLIHCDSNALQAANLGSEDQETADQSEKNINSIDQLLRHNLFEEAGSQLVPFFSEFVDYCVNRIKDQDGYIKELKAANERKDKELEELKMVKKKEPAVIIEIAETALGASATNTESRKTCCIESAEQLVLIKKQMEDMQAQITKIRKPKKLRRPTRMETPLSSSSKNKESLISRSQNNHNSGGAAAGFTPPNMMLNLRAPNYQNIDIPGHDDINDHRQQQQQIIEPSSSNNETILDHDHEQLWADLFGEHPPDFMK